MQDYNPLYNLLRSDGSVVVNKHLIFAIGLHEAIIYSELVSRFIYFADRDELTEDGYFYNTVDDLYSGTGLNEKPQRAAINNLKKLRLINYKLQGIPPKRYFIITDNFFEIGQLLIKGREKQAEILGTSKLRRLGGIKSAQIAELNTPYGRTNNTNFNNTKGRIQRSYINLPVDGHSFFNIYNQYFRKKFGRDHMKLSEEQLQDIEERIEELASCDVDEKAFKEAVIDHFNNLPKSNNGNIIAFLTASMRYFSVHTGCL